MATKEQREANAAYYLSRGRCPRCKEHNPVEPGKKQCTECHEKDLERSRAKLVQRREAGRCVCCGGPLDDDDGKRSCIRCRERAKQSRKKRRNKILWRYNDRKDEGKCVVCGVAWAEPGHSSCRKCIDKHNDSARESEKRTGGKAKLVQQRLEAGLCISCGKPTEDGHKKCPKHLASQRDSNRKYKIRKRLKQEAERERLALIRRNVRYGP